MTKKVLITGISGFIGRHVAKRLMDSDCRITAIVRPGTDRQRIKDFEKKVCIEEVDLAKIPVLKKFLSQKNFDYILHIGALRGGRHFLKKDFYRNNTRYVNKAGFMLAIITYCVIVSGIFAQTGLNDGEKPYALELRDEAGGYLNLRFLGGHAAGTSEYPERYWTESVSNYTTDNLASLSLTLD